MRLAASLLVVFVACGSATIQRAPRPADAAGEGIQGRVREWTIGEPIPSIPGRPFGIAVSPDGSLAVSQQDLDRITFVPAERGARRHSASVGRDPGDVVLARDGRTAITSAFYGGTVHFLDAATGEERGRTRIGTNAYRLALSPVGSVLYVTTTGGTLFALDVTTGSVLDTAHVGGSLQGIARVGAHALVVTSTDGTVSLLDARTLARIASREVGGAPQEVVTSLDDERIFVADEGRSRLLLLDARSLETLEIIDLSGAALAPFGLALSPDGGTLLMTSPSNGRIGVLVTASRTLAQVLEVGGTPRRIVFDRVGVAYAANEHGHVSVIR